MEFHLLHIFSILSLAVVASNAIVTPEVYWKSVLPNTPMPKAVTDLLHTEWTEEKSTVVGAGKGRVAVHTGKGTNVGVGKGGVGLNTGKPGKRISVGIGQGGVAVHTGHKGKPVYAGVHPEKSYIYAKNTDSKATFLPHHVAESIPISSNKNYASSEDQLEDNPNVALFFLEKDMHQGAKINLQFTKNTDSEATFLPRHVAESIPFSSNKLSKIYQKFSVKPDSWEAEAMKQTIKECEDKGIEGEEKYCATSLESMVDFSTSKLGKKVKAISTEVNPKGSSTITPLQTYAIEGVKKLDADKAVVCHKQEYAYAVFYCHKTGSARVYSISLAGADGTKAKAVAVCHTDTAKWNPKHLAFRVLKVKPGSVPVCHFLPQDNIAWVPY